MAWTRVGVVGGVRLSMRVSLLIDATVIRSVVLPSVTVLLGDRNWYLPRWLEWIPHLEVEGHVDAEP
jgi:uncharacterized membrane protein YdfJ with MMPL/SSD domain